MFCPTYLISPAVPPSNSGISSTTTYSVGIETEGVATTEIIVLVDVSGPTNATPVAVDEPVPLIEVFKLTGVIGSGVLSTILVPTAPAGATAATAVL